MLPWTTTNEVSRTWGSTATCRLRSVDLTDSDQGFLAKVQLAGVGHVTVSPMD